MPWMLAYEPGSILLRLQVIDQSSGPFGGIWWGGTIESLTASCMAAAIIKTGRNALPMLYLKTFRRGHPAHFCRYTSHYVAWSRTYDPRPFRQRL